MEMRLKIAFGAFLIALVLLFYELGTDVFRGAAIVIVGLLIVFFLLYIRRVIKRSNLVMWQNDIRAKRRVQLVFATVTKVENMIWKYSQVEDASLECEFVEQNGEKHIFKCTGIIGKFNVNVGDTVKVLVEPDKWSNYQIVLEGIVD
ncbi:MAG: hypothetical protein J6B19_04300 [Lachnospiraceae bacterium]|nr:hypothetical protein [Lachnospiraceae bacterium]